LNHANPPPANGQETESPFQPSEKSIRACVTAVGHQQIGTPALMHGHHEHHRRRRGMVVAKAIADTDLHATLHERKNLQAALS
jgi:hypothetical protein